MIKGSDANMISEVERSKNCYCYHQNNTDFCHLQALVGNLPGHLSTKVKILDYFSHVRKAGSLATHAAESSVEP